MRGLNESITKKVGAWLLEPKHTKRSLAASLGVSVATLNNRLKGRNGWTWSEISKLSDILACSTEELR